MTGRKVYITGATGYIGSHLVKLMLKKGIIPISIPRPGRYSTEINQDVEVLSWENLGKLSDNISNEHEPILINLAGHFINKHNHSDLTQIIDANFSFPLKMFEVFSRCSNSTIINIGTSWELSNSYDQMPINLYSCVKASNAEVFRWYCENCGLRGINLKLNDTYAGNDQRNKLLPYLKTQLTRKQSASLVTPFQRLNLLHIVDVCSGILSAVNLATDYSPGECHSFSLLHPKSIILEEIVGIIQNEIDSSFHVEYSNHHLGETRPLYNPVAILPDWYASVPYKAGLVDYFSDTHEYHI